MPAFTEIATILCLFCILLAPLAAAGLALINAGLGRSRSAAHAMLGSLCVMSVAALVYLACGFSWQGYPGRSAHGLILGGKPWSVIAAEPFFLRGLPLDGSPASLAAWLEMLSVGLAALIPLGSGADRWRLRACYASTALLAGGTYPLFAHWAWGGGWLAQLGSNYGLGRGFLDAGGSGSIHAVGGVTALAMAWILGPRRGKYSSEGMPAAIPGHNAVLVLLGCMLALAGWLGLNSAGAVLLAGIGPGQAVRVGVNTTLSAATAALVVVAITRARYGRPDASLVANGWIGGLVAGSAGCALVSPVAAAVIGAVAGGMIPFAIEFFELRLRVDDPGGAISVHGIAGLWGLLAVGLLVPAPGQGLAQWIGVATLLGFVLPMTYALNWLLDRVCPQRVAAEGERQGLDVYELGGSAYPEFVTHNEEFLPH